MLRAEVIDCPRSRLQPFRLGNDKMLGRGGFETVLSVAEVQFVPVPQELLHHRILGHHKLDDDVGDVGQMPQAPAANDHDAALAAG